jgi:rod shape determining protein RodA
MLDQYQKDRLIGFVHPDVDPAGTTYNVTQSITAVGSGGYDGRGVAGASQTNLDFLPEHNTDFIFSSLAEQRGFLGAAILLLLYALIAWRGLKIIAIAPTLFSAATAGAIVFTFLVQIFINVGMTIGIAPVTGIPLPFVSFGGSSMITTLAMVGLLEAIHIRGRLAEQ